ncbi:MAG: 2-polyprenyl-3-methyl-6-methoxy-1,4-benzoquinone monooxygenase [Burkholderiales bacterium]|nr:2-polyprenyl-3-methyl-6-methoxy-1,4-benzoquinone monooxygenase [Burkholderiales bacterium]
MLDRCIVEFDRGLRTLLAPGIAARSVPIPPNAASSVLSKAEQVESARLMRVNHTGEVCAQALYQGQALVARQANIRKALEVAAAEERDHLAWCEHRLDALGASVSLLNPAWYAGSFALGVVSGLAGDKWSMAFLVETERQVEHHLEGHLERLPREDAESRAIVAVMRDDEARHGQSGVEHGAADLPEGIKQAMKAVSRLMTGSTYWV